MLRSSPYTCACLLALIEGLAPGQVPRNVATTISQGTLPDRVHVFEDFETDIEKRWWLRGVVETNNVAPTRSDSIANRRACRATDTRDFDDKMGDPNQSLKAVVFNPVPGPPMGANTRLRFRFWLQGTDTLRVQIYSLTRNYHRFLTLTNLVRGSWQLAAVDMTNARRPDGSGGPLAEDERIDDIQFYVGPEAELLIDDIVLYEAAGDTETQPFPNRIVFTAWFDTGKQGAEWPGIFDIVPHEAPKKWKAARSKAGSARPSVVVGMRGERPLSRLNRLRFNYHLTGTGGMRVTLANRRSGRQWRASVEKATRGQWAQALVDFRVEEPDAFADELSFVADDGELSVDDALLFEPGAEQWSGEKVGVPGKKKE